MHNQDILERLKKGNATYMSAKANPGDVSLEKRKDTTDNGQHPYAIVVCCSDSRVIPEAIFSAGIGEIFTIRVAGNVITDTQLGSIQYAAGHLGSKVILVLGHTNCGAVDAAIHHAPDGFVKTITDEIKKAIGDETDPGAASCLNVRNSVKKIEESLGIGQGESDGLKVCGAIYHIEDGRVEFL